MVKIKEVYSEVHSIEKVDASEGTEGIIYLNTAKIAHNNKDIAKALEFYLKAGEAGEAIGYYELAGIYCCGKEIDRDFAKAFEYFQKAAKMGDARAHHALGVFYEYGHDRAQDMAKAKEHYQQAAQMGDFIAQTALDRIAHKEHWPILLFLKPIRGWS